MKKIVSLILVLCLAAAMLVACGSKEAEYKLGIGAAVTGDGLKVSTTVASVVLDTNGKVVACRIDAVDVKPEADDAGALTVAAEYPTKAELGDAYGMLSAYGSSLAEWYTQAEYFEGVVVGKTTDEIAAIKTGDAELTAGCTIDVTDFVKAVVAACKSEHKVDFKAADFTLGVSAIGGAELKEDSVKYTADLSAAVVADGKVVAAVIDSLEATVALENGEAGAFEYTATKLEQGDSYGMLGNPYGSSLAEWYDQAQAFANTAVGKAVGDVATLATEGVAGCTMYVGGYHKALVKAVANVR